MSRTDIYRDMEETLGLVPSFLKSVPDSTLEEEWSIFKKLQLADTSIPNKYKELIGLGLSAVTKCRYCVLYHTEVAKLFGATDEEIEEAVHYAKTSVGWSAYIQGLQIDYDEFKDEVRQACDFVRSKISEPVKASM
ncbi:MAG: carboxymuconolactone decarboxylase family protein [Armatimonadota bacterium]|nr:carboxymuconolactone decarboxylase family protein [Armatimonadota bacterium]